VKLTLLRRRLLEEIPSASGMEFTGDSFFVIGDDSAYLFELNIDFSLRRKIALLPSAHEFFARIPKMEKPDFEGLAHLHSKKMNLLLVTGSGSISGKREQCVLVDLDKNFKSRIFSPGKFYAACRQRVAALQGGELNLEAICYRKGVLHFFHRGGGGKNNVMVYIRWLDFLRFAEKPAELLSAEVIELPAINGTVPGISGAAVIPSTQEILFTAAIESAPTPVEDGPVTGSAIGVLAYSKNKWVLKDFAPVIESNSLPAIKVESVVVISESENELRLAGVTDADGGDSEWLEMKIEWK
jgi:hypothetical protein